MIEYEVQDVVCDYGVFENGELIPQLILNSRRNALTICDILNADVNHEVLPLEKQRHGRWIDYPHGSGSHCSYCNFKIRYKDKNRFKFCPNCCAIMDEVHNGI